MMEIFNVATIMVAGLMVGTELAIAVFVHPTLDRLPDAAHLPVATALARLLGKVMPFWYALTLLLTLAEALIDGHASGRWPVGTVAAAILWALAIGYSLIALVPVNNRIAAWTEGNPPADWKTYRSRWDGHHRWRVALLTLALALLIAGTISK